MSEAITDQTDTSADQTDAQPEAEAQPEKAAKTYSKAEMDGQIKKAVIAAKREFGDVLELRTKAEQFDQLQESSKSNEDKLRERADRMTRERDAALTRAEATQIRSAVISTASRLGSVDPEAVASLLSHDDLVIEGDQVLGVEEAVKALLNNKAYLRTPSANRAGAEMGGPKQEQGPILQSQIKAWAGGRDGGLTPERINQIEEARRAGRILVGR